MFYQFSLLEKIDVDDFFNLIINNHHFCLILFLDVIKLINFLVAFPKATNRIDGWLDCITMMGNSLDSVWKENVLEFIRW